MTKQFEGKVALVTGAASGIGRASALAFAREGAKTVVADVLVEGGEETVRIIKAAGGDALFVRTDVSKAAEVETLIQKVVETYGRLDYAHNKAGIRVNAVCPGGIRTPMLERVLADQPEVEASIIATEPIGRLGKPEEIAEAVV
jgi:NAD(P)-dependent dehydrogenase (short-subunit alcohol dehydrogenase family)